jgi:hypothetical protein
MMKGEEHVLSASLTTKIQGAVSPLLPDAIGAKMHEKMAEHKSEHKDEESAA